jgi:hypothetical protein
MRQIVANEMPTKNNEHDKSQRFEKNKTPASDNARDNKKAETETGRKIKRKTR